MVVRRAAADGRSGSGGPRPRPALGARDPFPVNEPELWPAYVPDGVTQYIRLFSGWGETKNERLRAAGYDVVVLDEGAEKAVAGADVRALMRSGGDWERSFPPAWRVSSVRSSARSSER